MCEGVLLVFEGVALCELGDIVVVVRGALLCV
mgnify:CR=1 FL=1